MAGDPQKLKLLALLLFDEFRYSQSEIANLMKVSRSTISLWVKEARYMAANQALQNELVVLRQQVRQIGYDLNSKDIIEIT